MTDHKTKKPFVTLMLAILVVWWMSFPYQGFMVYFLMPALLLVFAIRFFETRKDPRAHQPEFARIAIWLTSVAVILTVHHIRAGELRETADRVADKTVEYSAREGHCPESIERWITPDDAKAIHLIYACHNGKPGLVYMDSFEAIARYYYRFDKRAWEWNSG